MLKDREGKEIIVGDIVGVWGWDFWRNQTELVFGKVTGIGSENVEIVLEDGRKIYKRADLVSVDNENGREYFEK